MRIVLKSFIVLPLMIGLFLLLPASAFANTPARSVTVAAGPYIIDINLMQDPPYVDQPLVLTVVPHNHTLKLQGAIVARPGLGTNAVSLHASLQSTGDRLGTLQGSIHMPVKGAWQIFIELNGPQGPGSAKVDVVVGAPGAIPAWLAWLIGCTPLLGIAWWLWHQHNYRNELAARHMVSS